MRNTTIVAAVVAVLMVVVPERGEGGTGERLQEISFVKEVFPIIKRSCLPCHAEDNYNPSGLVLDTYETLMTGGEHGKPVEPGNGAESMLVRKLGSKPPFGEMMPINKKRKKGSEPVKKLSEEEVRLIVEWIDQGAKNN